MNEKCLVIDLCRFHASIPIEFLIEIAHLLVRK